MVCQFSQVMPIAGTPDEDDIEHELGNPSKKRKKDYYNCFKAAPRLPCVTSEVDNFLNENSASTDSILKYPSLVKIFVRYNTALPSSASVERLFSVGGQIFKPTRNRLSDSKFEMLLFLKLSSHF